jgi:UDP-GlcNAc:undecaprenyl-phosphate GlcNAc-1-phosphate transferase
VTYLAQALLAFFATALLIVWLRRPALRMGLVDHPGGRKRHGEVVPLTGGLALTAGFLLALSVSFYAMVDYTVLLCCVALLAAGGLFDDLGEMSPRAKLGLQVVAAVLMTSWGGHFLIALGDLFGRGSIELNHWSIPLTVFATVAVINGLNMLDGLDGLAGGLAFEILALFAWLAWQFDDLNALKLLVVLLGAVGGFLLFNWPHGLRGRRRVFMGDTGSLVLGFIVVWFAIALSQPPKGAAPAVLMLWAVGVILFDVFTVTVRRMLRRRDPAAPDRAHLHHLLLRRGFSPLATTTVVIAANALLGTLGVALWRWGLAERWLLLLFLLLGLVYLTLFLFPARFLRWGRKRAEVVKS